MRRNLFNVGGVVICIESSSYPLTNGKSYVVSECNKDSRVIKVENDYGHYESYFQERFVKDKVYYRNLVIDEVVK